MSELFIEQFTLTELMRIYPKKANLEIGSHLLIPTFSFLEEVYLGHSVKIRESCYVTIKKNWRILKIFSVKF